MDKMEYIITFENTNHAIKAEQCLLEQKLNVGVLPLPSNISAGCGICIRLTSGEIKEALEVLSEKNITGIKVYLKESGAITPCSSSEIVK